MTDLSMKLINKHKLQRDCTSILPSCILLPCPFKTISGATPTLTQVTKELHQHGFKLYPVTVSYCILFHLGINCN